MPNPETLTVYSSPSACVPEIQNVAGRPRHYIGRVFDPNQGPSGAFVLSSEPETIPFHPEYAKHLREGDLIAADSETALIAGHLWFHG